MSFPRLHSTALDCSNLHPLLHLGGRHYLSTTSSTLSVNGLTNRSTIHLSPLMVYHFPCEVTFPEQQTGFGAYPSRLEITVALFTPTHINYIPWHTAMDNSVLDLHSVPVLRHPSAVYLQSVHARFTRQNLSNTGWAPRLQIGQNPTGYQPNSGDFDNLS